MDQIQFTNEQDENSKFAINFNKKFDVKNKYSELMTCEAFLCFKPHLADKRPNKLGDDQYELAVCMPNSDPVVKQWEAALASLKEEKFGKKRGLKQILKDGSKFFAKKYEDAEEEGAEQEELDDIIKKYSRFKGMKYFTSKTKFALNEEGKRPQLVDEWGNAIEADVIKGNAILIVKIRPYDFKNDESAGITSFLMSVMMLENGEAFGSDQDSAADFRKSTKEAPEDVTGFREKGEDVEDPEDEEEEVETPAPKKKSAKKKVKPAPVEDPEEDEDIEEEEEEEQEEAPKPKKKKKAKPAPVEEPEEDEEPEDEDEEETLDDDAFPQD